MNPLISVIIPTFNRSATLGRTIESLLAQTYKNFEVIIVDDGSLDATSELLQKYSDERIRIIKHPVNKGVTAAKNTGLNNIKGEWFTILDRDDEAMPKALELMIKFPLEIDPKITAVTCNCIDSSTGKFSGKGLETNQYVDYKKILLECQGEFWGITKTDLLINDRFNEHLNGFEITLWYKIYQRSNRYYLHEALRIYHTTGNDRITTTFSPQKKSKDFQALSEEKNYLKFLKDYKPDYLAKSCLEAVIYLKADNKNEYAMLYFQYLKQMKDYRLYKIASLITYYTSPYIVGLGIKLWKKIK